MTNRILIGLTALSMIIGCASTSGGSHGNSASAHGDPAMNCMMAEGQGHEGMAHGAAGGAGMMGGGMMGGGMMGGGMMQGDKMMDCNMMHGGGDMMGDKKMQGGGMMGGKMMQADKTDCPMKTPPPATPSSGVPVPAPSPISGQEVAR